jgi:hypothetical protein
MHAWMYMYVYVCVFMYIHIYVQGEPKKFLEIKKKNIYNNCTSLKI